MIVCLRCGHENVDGRNLCQRCRAYLGWATAGAKEPDRVREAPAVGGSSAGVTSTDPGAMPRVEPIGPIRSSASPPPAIRHASPPAPVPMAPPTPVPEDSPTRAEHPSAPERKSAEPRMTAPGSAAPRRVTFGGLQSIPTVIADTPARYLPTPPPNRDVAAPGSQPFEAVRPDATGHPAPAADRSRSSTDLHAHGLRTADIAGETAVRCANCGHPSPAGRRFCRCGATLIITVAAADWAEPEPRLPWYRRLRDGIGVGSRFWRSMRHANQGVRARFHRGRSMKDHAVKLLAVTGVGAVGLGLLAPWGDTIRSQAWQRISAILPWSYTTVAATGASTDPVTQHPLDGFAVGNADDLDSGTAWAAPYTAPAPGPPCVRPSGAARLVITFASPVAVDRVSVLAGLPATSFDRTQQSRPKTVDVRLSNGACTPMLLTDTPAGQTIGISGRNITSITISVIDVFPGSAGSPTAGLVAISEVSAAYR